MDCLKEGYYCCSPNRNQLIFISGYLQDMDGAVLHVAKEGKARFRSRVYMHHVTVQRAFGTVVGGCMYNQVRATFNQGDVRVAKGGVGGCLWCHSNVTSASSCPPFACSGLASPLSPPRPPFSPRIAALDIGAATTSYECCGFNLYCRDLSC